MLFLICSNILPIASCIIICCYNDVFFCGISFWILLTVTDMNSGHRKDFKIWTMFTLSTAVLKKLANVVLVRASVPHCDLKWGGEVCLWLLVYTHPPYSSHIKVLLSNSANGAYSVKHSAPWGGKKVPLRSLQHSSHSVNPTHPTTSTPQRPSNNPSTTPPPAVREL